MERPASFSAKGWSQIKEKNVLSVCNQKKKENITFTPLNCSKKKWDDVLFCSDNFCDENLWESGRAEAWTWSSWYTAKRLIITLWSPPPGEQGETNPVLTHFNTLIEWFCPFSALFVILFWHPHDGKLTEPNSALILLRLQLYFFPLQTHYDLRCLLQGRRKLSASCCCRLLMTPAKDRKRSSWHNRITAILKSLFFSQMQKYHKRSVMLLKRLKSESFTSKDLPLND